MNWYEEEYERYNILNGLIDGNIVPKSLNWDKISMFYDFPEDVLWKYRDYVNWKMAFEGRNPLKPFSKEFVEKVDVYICNQTNEAKIELKKAEKELEELNKLANCLYSPKNEEKLVKDEKIGKWFRNKSVSLMNYITGHDKNGYIYERYSDGALIAKDDGWNDFSDWEECQPLIEIDKVEKEIVIEDNEFKFLEIEG